MSLRLVYRKSEAKGARKTRAGTYYIEGTDHEGKRVHASLSTGDRVLAKRIFADCRFRHSGDCHHAVPLLADRRQTTEQETDPANVLFWSVAHLARQMSAMGCRFNRSPQHTLRTSPLVSDTATSFLVAH